MLLPPIVQIVQLVLPILIQLLRPILSLLQPLIQLLMPIIELAMALLEPLLELINMILPPIIELFTTVIKLILPPLQAALSGVAAVLSGVFKAAFAAIEPVLQNVMNIFSNIINFVKNVFTGNWKGAWENVKNIFKNVADALGNIFKAPINYIIELINIFIRGLNKIKIPDWVPGVGGMGFHINEIPKLKVGLDYVPEDNFPALLHRGERVLTKEENEAYNKNLQGLRTDENNSDSKSTNEQTVGGNIILNIGTFINNTKEDIQELGEELALAYTQTKLAKGEG